MQFNEVLAGLQPDGDDWSCAVGEDWAQGRTVFGGLQTALAVKLLRSLVAPDIPLRVVQTTFMAPVPAGIVRLRARVLRSGKSAIHTECRLIDGDQTLCLVVAIFGTARESMVAIAPTRPEAAGADDPKKELPFLPGITPTFTQYFRFRWSEGSMPYTGARDARTKIHIQLRESGALDETHVVALADSIPSPAISIFKKPAASSSLTWTLEILDHDFAFDASAFWRIDAEVTAARGGYLAQTAELWNPAGRLCALSRQSVVVFA